jgi:hypothetical protein
LEPEPCLLSSTIEGWPSMAVNTLPTESFPAVSPTAGGRHPHISFPQVDASSDADNYADHSSTGLGPPPPMRHASVGLGVSASGEHQTEGRRRVRSVNVPSTLHGRPQPHRHALTARKRTLTTADPLKADKGRWAADSVDSSFDELEPGVFSNEYDLCEHRISLCLTSDIYRPLLAAHEGEILLYNCICVPNASLQTLRYMRMSNAL